MADKKFQGKEESEPIPESIQLSDSQLATIQYASETLKAFKKDFDSKSVTIERALSLANKVSELKPFYDYDYYKTITSKLISLSSKSSLYDLVAKSSTSQLGFLTIPNFQLDLLNTLIKPQRTLLDYNFNELITRNNDSLSILTKQFERISGGVLANHIKDLQNSNLLIMERVSSLIQVQDSFKESIDKLLLKPINPDLLFGNISKSWIDSVFNFKADFAGLKLELNYQRKEYQERRQMVIQLDNVKVENGFKVYQEIEREGIKYKLVEIPESQFEVLSQTTVSLGYSDNKQTFTAKASLVTAEKSKEKKVRFKYDSKAKIIILGNHLHTLIVSKSFRFIDHCLNEIFKDKEESIWYFEDLLDSLDPESERGKKEIKRCSNSLTYFKKSLPKQIQDLFTIGNSYIQINAKYR